MRRTPSQGRNNESSPAEGARGGPHREFKSHYQGGHNMEERDNMEPRSSRPGMSSSGQYPRLSGPPTYSSGTNGDRRMNGFGGAPMTPRGQGGHGLSAE